MRSELIKNGVRFLTHPDVQSTPLSQRAEFLEKKGLTPEEIQEAIRQAEESDNKPTAVTSPTTVVDKGSGWTGTLLSIAGFVGAGALVQLLWKQSASQNDRSTGTNELDELTESIKQHSEQMKSLLTLMKEREEFLKAEQIRNSSNQQVISQAISDLRTDIASFKTAETPPIAEVDEESCKYQKMHDAFRALHDDNSSKTFQEAAGILAMYVKNLIEHSDVPRYRRISTSNSNFKQRIALLSGHEEYLETIGFMKKGLSLEWVWFDDDSGKPDRIGMALLKASLTALELANAGKTSIDLISVQAKVTYEEHLKEVEEEEEGDENDTEAKIQIVEETKSTTEEFQTFLSKLKPSISSIEEEAEEAATAEPKDVSIEPLPEPNYPKSFAQVVNMVQNGDPIPDVQQIEDKLSIDADHPTPSSTSPLRKPWQNDERE